MLDTILFTVAGLVFGTVALVLCRAILLGRASKNWPIASGRIERSSVSFVRRVGSPICVLNVRYSYNVAIVKYEGTRVRFGLDTTDNGSVPYAAKRRLQRYSPEAAVNVRYDGRKPSRAVLETGITASTVAYAIGYFIACLSCVWVLLRR